MRRCIAKTLKGRRCKNRSYDYSEVGREAQRCRLHYWRLTGHERDEIDERLWEKRKAALQARKDYLEMTRDVAKLPPLKVTVSVS